MSSFPAISGGIPTKSQDLVASTVFTVAYALLLLPAIWRLFSTRSRSIILIRPTIFCGAQAAAYALRAVVANGNDSEKVFEVGTASLIESGVSFGVQYTEAQFADPSVLQISEILLLAGFILICEPIPALLTRVIGKEGDGAFPSASRQLQRKGLAILRIALVIALILGILAATDISSNESASTQAAIKHYRTANACLVIGAMAGSAVVAVYVAIEGFITSRAVLWLVIQGVLIVLTAAYKLENTLNPSDPYALKSKVVFYILNAAVQWCIGLWYFTFNLNDLFVDWSTLANGQAQSVLPSYAIPAEYIGRGTGNAPPYPHPHQNMNPNMDPNMHFDQSPQFGKAKANGVGGRV
ncbi:hypothetical protein JCM24511_08991 [Saitozyma sp. JCM 24511]|nr:hypothetical protein JCM24511_08991 [Saitozyma sp. JCM 24511]